MTHRSGAFVSGTLRERLFGVNAFSALIYLVMSNVTDYNKEAQEKEPL